MRLRGFLIALILALTAAAPLDSQPRRLEPMQVSGKKALIIANDRYRASPLQNPPCDACSMDGVLREFGFAVTTRFNLTQRAMEEPIDTRDFGASRRASPGFITRTPILGRSSFTGSQSRPRAPVCSQ